MKNNKNPQLVAAFVKLMADAGQPVEAVEGNGQIFCTSDGKAIRLRTNHKPAVMVIAASGAVSAKLPFEEQDFLGVIYRQGSKAAAYLIPSVVAAKAYRDVHTKWLAQQPVLKEERSQNNKTRVLKFDDAPENSRGVNYGFALTFAKYQIGVIDLDAEPPSPPAAPKPPRGSVGDVLTRYQRAIAAEFGVPDWAVHITINLVVGTPPKEAAR